MHPVIAYPVLALFPFYHCRPLLLCSCYAGPLLFLTYIRYVTSLKILVLVRSSRYDLLPDIPSFTHFSCSIIPLSTYIYFFSTGDFTQPFCLLWHQCHIMYTGECLNFGSDVFHNQTWKLCIWMLCHQKSALPFSSPLHVLHVFPIWVNMMPYLFYEALAFNLVKLVYPLSFSYFSPLKNDVFMLDEPRKLLHW